jgi:hypothetical protein
MSADEGARLPRRRPTVLDLPNILRLQIRGIRYEPPKLRNFKSRQEADREAVEFVAELDGPIPARAYGPALYVGDVEVRDGELVDDRTYRLVSFDGETLERDAPIAWGWMKDPPDRRRATKFRYSRDDEDRGRPTRRPVRA